MHCYKNFIGTLPLFLNFVFVFVFIVVCLFVCFTFLKDIDGRFSVPLTALITEILVYVRILDFHSREKAEIKRESF